MIRPPVAVIAVVLSLLLPACPSVGQDTPEEALLKRLTTTIVDARYESADLEAVISNLRERFNLNIQVPWRHIESLGIRRDDRIDIVLNDVSIATLLRSIIRAADPSGDAYLDFQIDQRVIVIAPRSSMEAVTLLRVYDITDLLESGYADRRFFSTPGLALNLTGNETLGGEQRQVLEQPRRPGGGGFGGGMGPPDRLAVSRMERVEELIDLLISLVTPEHWLNNGGATASVRAHGTTLFIRHTVEGHQRVEQFFHMLRDAAPRPLDAEAIIVRLCADRLDAWKKTIGTHFPRLTRAQLHQLTAEIEPADILFQGVTSGHNGNRFWFSALRQHDILHTYETTTNQGINAFAPVTSWITEGLELIALPRIENDADRINLDIQMAWIPPADVTERSVVLAPGAEPSTIDQAHRSMRTVSTSVELRLGDAIMLTVPGTPTENEWVEVLIMRFSPVEHTNHQFVDETAPPSSSDDA